MRSSDILRLFQQYAVLGVLAVVFGCAIVFLAYFIVYRKLLKRTKRLFSGRLVLWGMFVCYIYIVAGAVLLSRENGIYGYQIANISLFSSYRSAWFNYSPIEWRNLILNIVMFVPLGIFLPLLSEKLRRLWKAVGIGLAATVFIECFQLITGRGIFELDDIFHNTLGALIGYGLLRSFATIRDVRQRKTGRAIGWLSPLLIAGVVFVGIFVAYDQQEFGNIPETYAYRQNMSDVILSCEITLSDSVGEAMVYATLGVATQEQTRAFAEELFAKKGAVLDESRIDIYSETAIYYANNMQTNQTFFLSVDFRGMAWRYTDFSYLDETQYKQAGDSDSSNPSVEETSVIPSIARDNEADEITIRERLGEFGIKPPVGATFLRGDNGWYCFDAAPKDDVGTTAWGNLTCTYYVDGTIKEISNNLLTCNQVRMEDIISEKEAYRRLAAGCFVPRFSIEAGSLRILSVTLEYCLDTKGFLRPVYTFQAATGGQEITVIIPAQ